MTKKLVQESRHKKPRVKATYEWESEGDLSRRGKRVGGRVVLHFAWIRKGVESLKGSLTHGRAGSAQLKGGEEECATCRLGGYESLFQDVKGQAERKLSDWTIAGKGDWEKGGSWRAVKRGKALYERKA